MATAAQTLNQPMTSPVIKPATPKPPATDSVAGLIDIARQKSSATEAATGAEAAAEARAATARAAADTATAADVRGAFGKEQADLAKLDKEIPLPPPTQDTINNMVPLFSLVGMLAAGLGGKGTSLAGQNAQAALTGMIKGWNAGRDDVVQQNYRTYQENVQYLKDAADRVKGAFKDYQDNVVKFGSQGEQAEKLRQELTLAEADVLSKKAQLSGATAAEKASGDMLKFAQAMQAQEDRLFNQKLALAKFDLQQGQQEGMVFSPNNIDYLVGLAKAGDMTTVNQIMGSSFGNAGKLNRKEFLTALDKAGVPPAVLAQARAMFGGVMQGERTLGSQSGRVAGAIGALGTTVPLALEASEAVDRSQFPNLNSITNAIQKGTGGEEIVRFNAFNQALVNDYAQIMRRGGVSTDDASKRANDILSTAFAKGQYQAGVAALNDEAGAVQQGLENAKDIVAGRAPSGGGKPQPTEKDRAYVKAHPEARAAFIAHFGVSP